MKNNTHKNLSSWVNLDKLCVQCYNYIIEKWRKYQYSHCAYLKRLIYFQWHIYIFIIYQSAIVVIYTPYLSLTIWHDLLTSSLLLRFTEFPTLKKWINMQHSWIFLKHNRNSAFHKKRNTLKLHILYVYYCHVFVPSTKIKIIGFP